MHHIRNVQTDDCNDLYSTINLQQLEVDQLRYMYINSLGDSCCTIISLCNTEQHLTHCQYYYNNSIAKNQMSNGVFTAAILLLKLFTNIAILTNTMHSWLRYLQLHFDVIHLIYWFILSCIMLNGTKINKLDTFAQCKYLFNDLLHAIRNSIILIYCHQISCIMT